MKFFKKTGVAVTVLVLSVLAAVCIGLRKAPAGGTVIDPVDTPEVSIPLDEGLTLDFDTVYDESGILSAKAKKQIELYNANWDHRYNSVVVLVTEDSMQGRDIGDFAYDAGDMVGLGGGDALLALAIKDGSYYFATGADFDTIMTSSVESRLAAALKGKNDEACVLKFYEILNGVYYDNFGLGTEQVQTHGGSVQYSSGSSSVWVILLLLLLLIWILSAADRRRCRTYYTRYRTVRSAPLFRPILFWHGPSSSWYRRQTTHWSSPTYSGGVSHSTGGTTFGGGAKRTGSSFSSNRGSGFGGSRSGSSFSSSRGSSSHSSFSGSRGGSFGGGSSRSSGSSFGGSRSSGGSHGGGFSGGRGGGFGGRR